MTVAAVSKKTKSGMKLPITPFRNWLLALIGAECPACGAEATMPFGERVLRCHCGARQRVARRLDVNEKRVTEYLDPKKLQIDEAVVDRFLCQAQRQTLAEIYPDGAATVVAERPLPDVSIAVPPRSRCGDPHCDEQPLTGRFCPKHAARLAAIRADLDAEGALLSANGGSSRGQATRKPGGRSSPTCCAPHCWNPRLRGKRFCDECEAEGWTEEAGE